MCYLRKRRLRMKTLIMKFKLNTIEDIHLGNGLNCPGLYDDGFTKDHNGDPVFNYDTFKGLLRQSAHEIIYQQPDFKPEYSDLFLYKNQQSLDIMIRFDKKDNENPFLIHTYTRIDKKTRKASDKSLRSIECLKKGNTFSGEIRYLADNSIDLKRISDLLTLSLQNFEKAGGNRTRGLGKINFTEISDNIYEYGLDETNFINNQVNSVCLCLELKDNVTIADGALLNNNHYRTLDYFSGTSILGMLRVHLAKTEQDISILNDSNIQVSNFTPIPFDKIDYYKNQNKIPDIIPVPFTTRKMKKSGYEEKTLPHWVLKSNGNMIDKDEFIKDHKSESNKSFSGGYILNMNGQIKYFSVPVTIQMRNKINSISQSVSDKSLFTEEKILKNSYFQGTVSFKNHQNLQLFMSLMKPWLDKNAWLHVGRGSKPVEIYDYYFPEEKQEINIQDNSILITLTSDVILLDENGTYASIIKSEFLLNELNLANDQKIILKRHNSETRIIHSYHGLSGTRRFGVRAVKAGSVFEYQLHDFSQESKDKLENLLNNGLGLKKCEGFGKVVINHPVHLINNQAQNSTNIEILKPGQDDFCLKMTEKHSCKSDYLKEMNELTGLNRKKRILRYTLTFIETGTPMNIIKVLLEDKQKKVNDHDKLFNLLLKMLDEIADYETHGFILREALKGDEKCVK